jgi:predicted ATPase
MADSVVLRATGSGYLLEVDPCQLDAHRFEELAARAREAVVAGRSDAAVDHFRQALSLWRGPALDDLADRAFARIEASRLDEARLEAVEELAEAELLAGRPAAALALLEPHLAQHPLREQAWGRLMLALYRLGRQAEALRAYQDLRRLLGEELGLEPTPALRHLEQQILEQSPDLDRPSPRAGAPPSGNGETVASHPGTPRSVDTFAFLFTDIEASTRRWEGDQQAMASDLARHDQIMRQAVEAHHGHLFAHTGDGDQVAHPQLPSDFLLVRTQDAPLDNLPVGLTSFIGRQRELDELEKLLAISRLLTLTGVGGAGKTRLALRLAQDVRDRFPDGVWLVELGHLSDPSLVASEVMAALGILVSGLGLESTAPEARLCDYLRLRSVLLVLDTCEHVVRAVCQLVQAILAHCPQVTVLTTSREVLGLPGEVPWALPGLTLPPADAGRSDDLTGSDAVALFCARAASARPGFGLTDANADAVAQICRRLDGIPLALELAATRIRVLGAHQVAERLDDRFRLLSAGGRTAVSRHQTLRATMDWSYQLLPGAEQALLRRLAVFPQSFDLEAVEGISDDPAPESGVDVLDLLARLVDKSLVVVESNGADVRYRLLDTVREYATEKLTEAGETDAAHQRHRDFFLGTALSRHAGVVGRHRGNEQSLTWWEAPWMLRVDVDRENFHAALDWSLATGDHWAAVVFGAALWPYWLFWKGFLGTPHDRLERALSAPDPVHDFFRVEALIGFRIVVIEMGDGDPQRADELLREAHLVALTLDDPQAVARSRFYLGQTAHTSGDPEEGRRQLEMALAIYEATRLRMGHGVVPPRARLGGPGGRPGRRGRVPLRTGPHAADRRRRAAPAPCARRPGHRGGSGRRRRPGGGPGRRGHPDGPRGPPSADPGRRSGASQRSGCTHQPARSGEGSPPRGSRHPPGSRRPAVGGRHAGGGRPRPRGPRRRGDRRPPPGNLGRAAAGPQRAGGRIAGAVRQPRRLPEPDRDGARRRRGCLRRAQPGQAGSGPESRPLRAGGRGYISRLERG